MHLEKNVSVIRSMAAISANAVIWTEVSKDNFEGLSVMLTPKIQ